MCWWMLFSVLVDTGCARSQPASSPISVEQGMAANYRDDVGIGADPNVIFAEGFETGELPTVGYDQVGGFYDLNGYPKQMHITDEEAAVGQHSLELIHPQGTISPQWIHRRFAGVETIYVRFYRKYESGWIWPPLGAHDTAVFAGRYTSPAATDLTLYLDVPVHPSFTGYVEDSGAEVIWTPLTVLKSSYQGPGLDFGLDREILSHVGWDNYYGMPRNTGYAPVLEAGRWYCFEYMGRLNSTPGGQDGEVRMWVEGQLVTEMTGLVLRNDTHADINWDHWFLGPRYGGGNFDDGPPRQQKSWIDAIVVSRSYIGPVASVGATE